MRKNTNAALGGGGARRDFGSADQNKPAENNRSTTETQAAGPARKSKSVAIAEAILRDREKRNQKPAGARRRAPTHDFNPFAFTRWRVVAGGDAGYLVKTPMRMGPVGWFISCQCCGGEFESKGWAYCPPCMELPAEERRDHAKRVGRQCQRPGCGERLSLYARADARFCSAACRKAAERTKCDILGSGLPDTAPPEMSQLEGSETGIKSASLIGPKDFPINIVGGFRFPQAGANPLGRVRVRLWRAQP